MLYKSNLNTRVKIAWKNKKTNLKNLRIQILALQLTWSKRYDFVKIFLQFFVLETDMTLFLSFSKILSQTIRLILTIFFVTYLVGILRKTLILKFKIYPFYP